MVAGKMFLAAPSKKQAAYYRRAYRKKRRYAPKKAVNRIKKGVMPYVFNNVMSFSTGTIYSDVGINFFTFGLNANKISDVLVTGGSITPRWYAEMAALYTTYRVYAVKVKLIVEDTEPNATAETSIGYIGFVNDEYGTPSSTLEVQQKPRTFKTRTMMRNTGQVTMFRYSTVYKIQQETRSRLENQRGYSGRVSDPLASPTQVPKIYVGAFTLDEAGSTSWRFRVTVDYYTQWSVLRDV